MPKGSWGSSLYRHIGTARVTTMSPTHIQVSLASTLHCHTLQGSGLRALSMLVPVRPSWAFWIPVPTRPWLTGSDLLVPGLDFLPSYQQQLGHLAGYMPSPPPWATRACRNIGTTVGYPEIIPTIDIEEGPEASTSSTSHPLKNRKATASHRKASDAEDALVDVSS